MPKLKHTCKFMRILIGSTKVELIDGKKHLVQKPKTEVFKCQIPGCSSYYHKPLAIGQRSLCWNCNEELILDSENTRLKKPTHPYCRRYKGEAA